MQQSTAPARQKGKIYARQIAFAAAFILPLGKFLETPSILSKFAKGDILLPALLHFLVQSLILLALLYASSKSDKPLLLRLKEKLGKGTYILFAVYALYFLYAALLPLLDLEKFVYAVFFDTAPTTFSFGAFFLLLAFVCSKGIKSLGRCADLSLFLFLLPFLALVGMACFNTDLTRLLPFFGTHARGVAKAFVKSTPHFSDAALLLPLISSFSYKKRDGVKIMTGYWVGALFTLSFFAVFFGVFSTLAPREHYAFSKIAQYFSALDVVGRIDLLFVYLLSVVLLFYTCLPLVYVTELTSSLFHTQRKTIFSAVLSFLLFLFVLFANQYYDALYGVVGGRLPAIFWFVADLLPTFLFLLPSKNATPALKKSNGEEKVHV